MQVSNANNVKIYNLSAGKSLPEWLTDRQKRKLQNKDEDIRRRLELIQDFEMPSVSNCVKISPDGEFIGATGTYKPRFKCYDVHELCCKFERGLDAEVINFEYLSEDYSKVCFLQDDRYVEFHTQFGRLFRMRIPKYGRDLAYYPPSCDMYFVGVSSEIYRINLEKGRFMKPLQTSSTEFNCCEFNPTNYLFGAGSKSGHFECWDPRARSRSGILDIATSKFVEDYDIKTVPEITAMKFRDDGLTVALGTNTGHVLLYDLRALKPFQVKDHNYELPIKSLEFQDSQGLVLSMDSKILKLWDRNTGKHLTAIEPGAKLNQLCTYPDSGLLFMANEDTKILTYFIPSLGPAPRWCTSLDGMTEELEEKADTSVYDDYKFVTRLELEELGLDHLVGTNLLRAVMHGYFLDMRLYHKAKAIADPFAFDKYRKTKVREKIEEGRASRVNLKKLPSVNKDLAMKLMDEDEATKANPKKRENKAVSSILKDDRFSAMFSNPDFQIDPESEEFRLINPVMSKLDKARKKRQEKDALKRQFTAVEGEDEPEGKASDDDSSSDDERTWTDEVKLQHRLVSRQRKREEMEKDREEQRQARLFEIKDGEELGVKKDPSKKKEAKKSLAERLQVMEDEGVTRAHGSLGHREMTISLKKEKKVSKAAEERNQHQSERKKLKRSAGHMLAKPKAKFWMGKKV